MKTYNITIQDTDAKVLEPILKRLSVDFTKKTLKEDDDPVLIAEAERVKNDKPLSKKESDKAIRDLRNRVKDYEKSKNIKQKHTI